MRRIRIAILSLALVGLFADSAWAIALAVNNYTVSVDRWTFGFRDWSVGGTGQIDWTTCHFGSWESDVNFTATQGIMGVSVVFLFLSLAVVLAGSRIWSKDRHRRNRDSSGGESPP